MSLRSCFAGALSLSLLALFLPLDVGCQATCSEASDCGDGEYCSIPSGACLTPKSIGFCKPRPAACSGVRKPVCGCDGKTYDNACEASKQGAALAGDGACDTSCGGPMDLKCGEEQYCELPSGACLGPNALGQCQPKPTDCTTVQSPVCGCDGQTYSNACEAARMQMNVATTSACDAADGG
jgi:hypothetical protein